MLRIRRMIGMPVIFRGRKIGRLVQAELSADLKRLEGIWVDRGLKGTRYIASEQLEMIGSIAVMADGISVKRRFSSESPLVRAVSTDGCRSGAVVGAEIDELSFLVTALELTCGFWDDLYNGRRRVERYTFCPERKEVIIMETQDAHEKEE